MGRSSPRVVIVGAGIVGCALADELTARGWTDVTVLEQGPLFATGGSSSHAPGLVFQTNPSKTMTKLARYTVEKYAALDLDGEPCFLPVGGLELATTPERWADLHRKLGWARSWGVAARLVGPEECRALHPLLAAEATTPLYGGLRVPGDGLAAPLRAAEAQARRAAARGADFRAHTRVTAVRSDGGGVTGVATDRGDVPADVVVSCAGMWGPLLGELADTAIPLVPMAHQYVRTTPLPGLDAGPDAGSEAAHPILRHQDRDLYVREHGAAVGIGSYAHRPMPVAPADIGASPSGAGVGGMPSTLPFTPEDFAPSWRDAVDLLPALADAAVAEAFNGLFSFTPDGFPLLGESATLCGFWLAEAVWITHSAGVARAMAEWLVEGRPRVDLHECDLNRSEAVQLAPAYVLGRACRAFVEVYDIVHPLQPMDEPRPLRTSLFHTRQQELGAVFGEAAGWERPLWFEANGGLPGVAEVPPRDAWAAGHWSPIAGGEARATRGGVALYDMTPLKRLEVTGPGALDLLQELTTNDLARPPGKVTYTLMLDAAGGVCSDLTVTRLTRHLPKDSSVQVCDTTAGTCCLGVWGPRARDLVQPLTRTGLSHGSMGYFTAVEAHLGEVPVTMLRLSYVGELGWEVYTSADLGGRLWDTLWAAGQELGIVAAGRAAFGSLRLEKGYRAWGTDVTAEHDPYEAGLGFAVRLGKGDFVGRSALLAKGYGDGRPAPARRLTCLTLDEPTAVVLGKEPVLVDGTPVGYVTSAAHGHTIGTTVAYAWLPAAVAVPGTPVAVEWFGQPLPASVSEEPLVDPAMTRLRR